jgi:hypothetical protein
VTTPPPDWGPDAGAVGTEAWFAYVTTHEPDGTLTQYNAEGVGGLTPVGQGVAYALAGGFGVSLILVVALLSAWVFGVFGFFFGVLGGFPLAWRCRAMAARATRLPTFATSSSAVTFRP